MTLQTTNNVTTSTQTLNGNMVFIFDYRMDLATDAVVTVDNVAESGFSITGLGEDSGGSVTLITAPTLGAVVVVARLVPETQDVSYPVRGAFPAPSHENAMDRLTMMVQQQNESVNRSLRYPLGDTSTVVLDTILERSNKYFGFDGNGNPISLGGTGSDPDSVKRIGVPADGNLMEWTGGNAQDSGSAITDLAQSGNIIYLNVVIDSLSDAAANSLTIANAIASASPNGRIVAPSGQIYYDTTITLPSSVSFIGSGIGATQFTKTTDVVGMRTTGVANPITISGFTLDSDIANTSDGLVLAGTARKFVSYILSTGHGGNGIVYSQGNLSSFGNIQSVSNGGHGMYLDTTTTDSNAPSFWGTIDLRGNGGGGFIMATGFAGSNVCQQAYGGLITCQNNTGSAAVISGRGHKLTLYDESNGAGIELDSNSSGLEISVLFGSAIDNGTNNDIILSRVLSVEAGQHQRLMAKQISLSDLTVAANLDLSQTASNEFLFQISGTSSTVNITIDHPSASTNVNIILDGDLTANRYLRRIVTWPDGDTTPSVGFGDVFNTANTSGTSVTTFAQGVTGQEITIVFNDSNTTIVSGTVIRLSGGVNFTGTDFDTLTLVYNGPGLDWHEISRSSNA